MTAAADKLAQGDISQDVTYQSPSEMGQLAEAFRSMIASMRAKAEAVDQFSRGNLTAQVEVASEHDLLGRGMVTLRENMAYMVEEIQKMIQAAKQGQLNQRGRVEQFQGSFRDIVQGINETLDAVIGPLNVAADALDRFGKGESPHPVEGTFLGDFGKIQHGVNGTLAAVRQRNQDLQMLITAAKEGKLSVRVDTTKYTGYNGKLMAGLNEMCDSIIGPLQLAARYLDQISKGEIPPHVTENYQGEFNTLKNNLNTCIDAVMKPIREAADILQQISMGDLTVRVHGDYQGDHAAIKDNINKMADDLQRSMGEIGSNVQALSAASDALAKISTQMGTNAEESASQANLVSAASEQVSRNVQTVATGIEEMSASIQEIAKNASTASKIADSAVAVARSATTTVSQLGESSNEIGKVIKVITSIAEQTNLLALNATIEAARAGEAGKGFAVVANEVKELAKETAKATEEIRQKIETIQQDTRGAVGAIKEIDEVIGRINDISTTIASAVEEQTVTTNEISRNITEAASGTAEIVRNIAVVAQTAQNTSEGVGDTQKAGQELAQMAAELGRLIAQFKYEGSPAERGSDNRQGQPASAGRRNRPQAVSLSRN